jgi:hypothetical protein
MTKEIHRIVELSPCGLKLHLLIVFDQDPKRGQKNAEFSKVDNFRQALKQP